MNNLLPRAMRHNDLFLHSKPNPEKTTLPFLLHSWHILVFSSYFILKMSLLFQFIFLPTGFNLRYATLRLFCPKEIDILFYWQIEACHELLHQVDADVCWKRKGFFNNSVRHIYHDITPFLYHSITYHYMRQQFSRAERHAWPAGKAKRTKAKESFMKNYAKSKNVLAFPVGVNALVLHSS